MKSESSAEKVFFEKRSFYHLIVTIVATKTASRAAEFFCVDAMFMHRKNRVQKNSWLRMLEQKSRAERRFGWLNNFEILLLVVPL